MTLIKTVAIALITAIANPLCCCLTLSASEVDEPIKKAEHACCSTSNQQSEDAGDTASDHASDACPHEQEKSSQISQSVDSTDSLLKPVLTVAEFLPTIVFGYLANGEGHSVSHQLERLLSPPSTPTAQDYCVFLL